MSCYVCSKIIKCSCDEELKQGTRFKYLTCMTTDDYPCIQMLPTDKGIMETHVCSSKCQEAVMDKTKEYYNKLYGGKIKFTSLR